MKTFQLFITCAAFLVFWGTALAITIHVPDDQPTIQAGIDAASDGDTVLVADGTYTGDGNMSLDFGGKAIVVKSENGPENCIIDCVDGKGIPFFFDKGETSESVVDGFTMKNGSTVIVCLSSFPTIINNILTKNGGGIDCFNSSAIIKNNIIAENGFGISCYESSPLIIGNRISDNGGGIYILCGSSPTIKNNIVANNTAAYGSGIYCSRGGTYCDESTPSIINNTIIGNSAENGGGIYSYQSSPMISNNIVAFSKKWSPDRGEPKLSEYSYQSTIWTFSYSGGVLTGATFYSGFKNTGGTGDVTISVRGLQDTTLTVKNGERYKMIIGFGARDFEFWEYPQISKVTIRVFSSVDTLEIKSQVTVKLYNAKSIYLISDGFPAAYAGGIVAIEGNPVISYCDIYSNEDGNYFVGATSDSIYEVNLTGIDGNISQDPLCVAPDYLLSSGSPCIDAGNPDPRFNDPDGSRNDMGAYGGQNSLVTRVEEKHKDNLNIPEKFQLFPNYPNPFNPETTIKYQLSKTAEVSLRIYNITGQLVKTLINEKQPAGYYIARWNGRNEKGYPVSGGLYISCLKAADFVQVRKMVLIK